MARAGTRSQAKPSQSQPRRAARPSQSQRGQRGNDDDEEQEQEQDDNHEEQDEYADGDAHMEVADKLETKANNLVRLALFVEQRRIPLKRDEISKKVMGNGSRDFNAVLARAQEILHKTFGMELVELPSKAERDKEALDQTEELMKNTGVKKRGGPSGSKTYILRSMLHPNIIEAAVAPDEELLALEQAEPRTGPADDDADNALGTRPYGSILAWHTADQLAAVGTLYVLLALILVDGRVLSDTALRAHLKRLRLPPTAPIPQSSRAPGPAPAVDAYLAQLVRQGFLERTRAGAAPGAKRGGARGGGAEGGADDGAWEWRWGARARCEVGERAVARFVAEFMVDRAGAGNGDGDGDESGGEDGGADADAERAQRLDAVMRGIERSASGGPLADIK